MLSRISALIFKLIGWKIIGEYPHHIKKKLLIVVPHTSYVDFFIGILTRSILKARIQFVGKHTLFREPLGTIMRFLGGVSVDRRKSNNMVDALVQIYNSREEFCIVFAPEGTRKKVLKFKTGFYYVAKQAQVPIIPIKFDYQKKEVHLGDPFYPTDNAKQDIAYLENYYRGVQGRKPELSFN